MSERANERERERVCFFGRRNFKEILQFWCCAPPLMTHASDSSIVFLMWNWNNCFPSSPSAPSAAFSRIYLIFDPLLRYRVYYEELAFYLTFYFVFVFLKIAFLGFRRCPPLSRSPIDLNNLSPSDFCLDKYVSFRAITVNPQYNYK